MGAKATRTAAHHEDLLAWADQLNRHGVPGAAADVLRTVLRTNPGLVEARLMLAEAFLGLGDAAAARHALQPVLDQTPSHSLARAMDAYAALILYGSRALPTLRDAAMLPGAPALAWWALAMGERSVGNPRGALLSTEKAVELDPDHAGIHLERGRVLASVGRFQEAAVSYHRVVALAPGWADARYELGQALARAGRRTEAAEVFAEGMDLFPDVAEFAQALLRETEYSEPRERWGLGLIAFVVGAGSVSGVLQSFGVSEGQLALIALPVGIAVGAAAMSWSVERERGRRGRLPSPMLQARRHAIEAVHGRSRRRLSALLNGLGLLAAVPMLMLSIVAAVAYSEPDDVGAAAVTILVTSGLAWYTGRKVLMAIRGRRSSMPGVDRRHSPRGCQCGDLVALAGPHGRGYAEHLEPRIAGEGFTEYECPHTGLRWLGWQPTSEAMALIRVEARTASRIDPRDLPGQYL